MKRMMALRRLSVVSALLLASDTLNLALPAQNPPPSPPPGGGFGASPSGAGIPSSRRTTERIHGGAVATDRGGGNTALSLDTTSEWSVTADSTLTRLPDHDAVPGEAIEDTHGNGHTVLYGADSTPNQWLCGKTCKLSGGGTLFPAQHSNP